MTAMAVDLNEMLVFARVVQAGSFTAAAAELHMPKSTVSRKVTELETRLKSRLLQRTTRKLSLTDAGRTYYDYCARIAGEIDEAERAVSSLQQRPRGLLRVTAPANFGFLAPIISDFLRRYPEVSIELLSTTRRVDLIEERYDLAIRAGTLADSTMISRSLGSVGWFLVATPAYLRKRGRPRAPQDLEQHDCLLFGAAGMAAGLQLERADRSEQVALSPRLVATEVEILHDAVTASVGITVLPAYLCVDDLRAKRLERVLRDWTLPPTPMQFVYPSTRHVSPKVKFFVDHVHARLTPPPWELGPIP
jgi:DNA-binding transcriptional LysR family regulator